ncbi:MAG: putative aminoglycoside phosphotransferase [Acidimicrobiales bacterium]|nr:MAG: putative aminoglycoside phosphotransferase [Acidimicrobiales bacterium]
MTDDRPNPVDPSVVDIDVLAGWMDARGLAEGALTELTPLAGGTQNLLLRFVRAGRTFVLRRPPEHKRRNSDETMRREARVLAALAGSEVPHPALIAAESDIDVLGAAFYLMEPVDGFTPTSGLPAYHAGDPAVRRAMGFSLADAAAALGRVDHVAVGLDGFGKPEGYLERQVPRWRSQLESYAELGGDWTPDIPHLDGVGEWLDANRPATFEPGVIHGDYHLGNVMYRHDTPDLAAVVDWELATIGDPLIDLGLIVAFWPEEGGQATAVSVTPWDGFPSVDEMVARYGDGSTRDLSAVNWYGVLACYKTGIILEGTHARAMAGQAPKAFGDMLHATTVGLFNKADLIIRRS